MRAGSIKIDNSSLSMLAVETCCADMLCYAMLTQEAADAGKLHADSASLSNIGVCI
jgi:hypothetical protein